MDSRILPISAAYQWTILLGQDDPAVALRGRARYFRVLSSQGAAWGPGLSMREQRLWPEHSAFMNSLADGGFVLVGGALDAPDHVHRALLVVDGEAEAGVRDRLSQDPWTASGILAITAVGSGGHGPGQVRQP